MKKFNICVKDNTDFFGLNLNKNNVFGCISVYTKHIGYNGKVLKRRDNQLIERKMLYCVKDLQPRGINNNVDNPHFIAYYAMYPNVPKGENPNMYKVKWQKGTLAGSCLLENMNRIIMNYVEKFYVSETRDTDKHVFSGDNPINGLYNAAPRRKDHQQELLYKSAPQQCNRHIDDTELKPKHAIVHSLHKTLTKDKNGNPINNSTVAHNRALEAWKAERRLNNLPCDKEDEHIFFEENSLLKQA